MIIFEYEIVGEKVIFRTYVIKVEETKHKLPYLYTQLHYKRLKYLCDIVWDETNVDWKIRASLLLKSWRCHLLLCESFMWFRDLILLSNVLSICNHICCEDFEYLYWAWTFIRNKHFELEYTWNGEWKFETSCEQLRVVSIVWTLIVCIFLSLQNHYS